MKEGFRKNKGNLNDKYRKKEEMLLKFLKLLFIFFITFLFTSCSAIIGNNNFNPGDNWESIVSEHLICYYRADSFAEENIEQIVQIEEGPINI